MGQRGTHEGGGAACSYARLTCAGAPLEAVGRSCLALARSSPTVPRLHRGRHGTGSGPLRVLPHAGFARWSRMRCPPRDFRRGPCPRQLVRRRCGAPAGRRQRVTAGARRSWLGLGGQLRLSSCPPCLYGRRMTRLRCGSCLCVLTAAARRGHTHWAPRSAAVRGAASSGWVNAQGEYQRQQHQLHRARQAEPPLGRFPDVGPTLRSNRAPCGHETNDGQHGPGNGAQG